MIMIKKYERLTDLPQRFFEGYIWSSNDTWPKPLHNKSFEFQESEALPFIQEALLYCRAEQVSIHILHAGAGEYSISEYQLSNLPKDGVLHPVAYLPHRIKGVKKLHFQQLWLPEKDALCADMEVLKMKALIFSGFIK